MQELVSFEEAQSIVLARCPLQPEEFVSLNAALGRTLSRPVVSTEDVPPFPNSAMDGYAVRTGDLTTVPVELRITGEIRAGQRPATSVSPGTCIRIMTGAPFPEGADAVVPVEETAPGEAGKVRILRRVAPGTHVRAAGGDVRRGDTVLPEGIRITPPVVGMLATLGVDVVPVRCSPLVAVVATGDELVEVGEQPGPGQIRNANGPALAAQATAAGARVLGPLHARDDAFSTRAVVEQSLEADVLVFSGGVSVGDYDLVRQVLEAQGTHFFFWRVRQRPGKPFAFGELDGRLVFGLPGNPVSSAVCFEQYVRPALARMLGRREVVRPRHAAVLAAPIAKKAGLHHFVRGVASTAADGRMQVQATGPQGSNLYSSMLAANCLIHLPEDMEDAPAGAPVEIEWLSW